MLGSQPDDVTVGSYLLLGSITAGSWQLPITGWYEDRFVRDQGRWRFAHRILTLDAQLA